MTSAGGIPLRPEPLPAATSPWREDASRSAYAVLRVLRLTSVFEPPDAVIDHPRGARFDPIGGMQNHTAQLTRALDRLGVAHDVVTARRPGAPRTQHFSARATVHRLGLPVPVGRQLYSLPATRVARRLAAQADVVHAHLGEDLAVLPLAFGAARTRRLPVVVTVHTSLAHTFSAAGLRSRLLKAVGGHVERRGCAGASQVIVLTPRLADRVGDAGIPADRLHVIPSGVVPADFLGGPVDPAPHVGRPRIVFAGRLARQKGVDVLAAALPLLRTAGAELLVAGDGPERGAFEDAVRRAGLADRVHVLGFRPHHEIPGLLRSADVVVLPSVYEELGSVLLEAMQAGRPIVASRTGGIPDAVGDAALLVAPSEPVALAAALDRVLGDADLRAALGARAAERARRFDWAVLAREVLGVYELAVGART